MIAIDKIKQLSRDQLGPVTVLAGEDIGQYSLLKQALLSQLGFDASDLTISYFDLAEVD